VRQPKLFCTESVQNQLLAFATFLLPEVGISILTIPKIVDKKNVSVVIGLLNNKVIMRKHTKLNMNFST
jgi:hypothetical protein